MKMQISSKVIACQPENKYNASFILMFLGRIEGSGEEG